MDNKNMKEKFLKIISTTGVTIASFVIPFIVLADTGSRSVSSGGSSGGASFPNPTSQTSINDLIVALLDIVVQIGTVVAVLFLVYSGFLFVLWTIIGGIIILGAFALSEIIRNTARNLGANV